MGLPSIKDLVSGGLVGLGKTAEGIISRFKADPTKVAEIEKDLEQLKITSELEAQRIGLEAERIKNVEVELYLKDTQSARDANVKIQESDKASWLAKNVAYIIDLFLTALWGTVTTILFLKIFKIAATDVDMVSLMALHGTVTAVYMIVVNFHRGTSRGSEDKSKELKELRELKSK